MSVFLIVEKKLQDKEQIKEIKRFCELKVVFLERLSEGLDSLDSKNYKIIIILSNFFLERKNKNLLLIEKKIKKINSFCLEIAVNKSKINDFKYNSDCLIHGFGENSYKLIKKIIERKNEKQSTL